VIRRLKPETLMDWFLILLVFGSALALIAGCAVEIRQRVEWFGPHNARTNAVPKSPPQR
jgi:hypothetical protein